MTDDRRDRAGYSRPDCIVCGGQLRVTDPVADRRVLEGDGSKSIERGHRACLKEGVERWNRLNRPHSSPLGASRIDGWDWHDEPVQRLDRRD